MLFSKVPKLLFLLSRCLLFVYILYHIEVNIKYWNSMQLPRPVSEQLFVYCSSCWFSKYSEVERQGNCVQCCFVHSGIWFASDGQRRTIKGGLVWSVRKPWKTLLAWLLLAGMWSGGLKSCWCVSSKTRALSGFQLQLCLVSTEEIKRACGFRVFTLDCGKLKPWSLQHTECVKIV